MTLLFEMLLCSLACSPLTGLLIPLLLLYRQSSQREEGTLEVRFERLYEADEDRGSVSSGEGLWEERYVVFEEDELKYSLPHQSMSDGNVSKLSMEKVISFRTNGSNTIIISISTELGKELMYLRSNDATEINKWKFVFQKCIARVINSIASKNTDVGSNDFVSVHSINGGKKTNDIEGLTGGLSPSISRKNGDTQYNNVSKLAGSLVNSNLIGMKSYVLNEWNELSNKSVVDLTRFADRSPSNHSGSTSSDSARPSQRSISKDAAMSPAIPIRFANYANYNTQEKLASSFKDETEVNGLMYAHMNDASASQDFDDNDSDDSRSDSDNGDEMMFSIEDGEQRDNIDNDKVKKRSESNIKGGRHSVGGTMVRTNINGLPAGLRIASGYCSKIGPRSKNEDTYVSDPDVDISSKYSPQVCGYFAVYDGHSGVEASELVRDTLHLNIIDHESFPYDMQKAITETVKQFDKDFLAKCKESKLYCGTTALGAFIVDRKLCVFNIGDCQAYLCRNSQAIPMNNGHKPGRTDELERIKRANGWVTEEKELYMGRLHRMDLSDPLIKSKAEKVNWTTIHRVCGELAVSRSIGDPFYKSLIPGQPHNAYFLWPEGHNTIFNADLVIPDPEFEVVDITVDDEFLIIASDGLWDVLSGEEASGRVRQLITQSKTVSEICAELCDLALRLGSSDNVTIVLVQFHHDT